MSKEEGLPLAIIEHCQLSHYLEGKTSTSANLILDKILPFSSFKNSSSKYWERTLLFSSRFVSFINLCVCFPYIFIYISPISSKDFHRSSHHVTSPRHLITRWLVHKLLSWSEGKILVSGTWSVKTVLRKVVSIPVGKWLEAHSNWLIKKAIKKLVKRKRLGRNGKKSQVIFLLFK